MNIPNFEIEKELGKGGMSTVYLARQVLLNRQVALKVMDPALGREQGFLDKFLDEGRIVAHLEHPNIVRVYDVGIAEDSSSVYMAMEYLPGGSLKEKLVGGKLSLDATLQILEQVGAGLGLAHEQGFIHRDIKPANILFRKDGTAVLTDFGIAKLQESTGELTRMGYTLGTVKYMSPEQASTTKLDRRSDIYSLGLVFFEMLTGRAAVAAESTAQALHSHVALPPPTLPQEYAWLQAVLNRVLAKAPADRYATVDEFIRAVRDAADPQETLLIPPAVDVETSQTRPTQIVEPAPQSGMRNKPLWISSLVGLLLVGVIVAAFYWFGGAFDSNKLLTSPVPPPVTDSTQQAGQTETSPFPVGGASERHEKINLVFDASGSMKQKLDGVPKIDIARDVLKTVVAGWDDNTERGLLVYGHRKRGDCSDIEQVVPVGTANKQAFIDQADHLTAMGETPIAKALLMAAEDLQYTESKATVILVSDGKEECGGDPCAVAKELEKQGIDFTAHVIGFDVTDPAASEQLRCIAEATGGDYQAAQDREEFQAMLAASQTGQTAPVTEAPEPSPVPVTPEPSPPEIAEPQAVEPPPVTPTPPPAVTTGTLKVVSISARTGKPLPADISVYRLDDQSALPVDVFALLGIQQAHAAERVAFRSGVTEASFTLKSGKYRVNVRTAEDDRNFDVTVSAGKTVSKSIKMADPAPEPKPPPPGVVKVSAVDAATGKALRATFYVATAQGKQISQQEQVPTADFTLEPGEYQITARITDDRVIKQVNVVAGKTLETRFELKVKPPEPEPAMLVLRAVNKSTGKAVNANFVVLQGRKQIAIASGSAARVGKLPAGEYTISATSGRLLRGSSKVTLKPGEQRELVVELVSLVIEPPRVRLPEVIKPEIIKPEVVRPVTPVRPEIIRPETIKPVTPVQPESRAPSRTAPPEEEKPKLEDALKQRLQGELFKRLGQ